MMVFVAGASGAVGRRLVPQLVARGHAVVASSTRTSSKTGALRALGAQPVVVDGLDAQGVAEAVATAEPEVVIHEMSALEGAGNPRRFDEEFALTNRLRTEGLDHLLAAARAVATRRFIAQSYAGWPNIRRGGPVKTEEDPLDPDPPAGQRESLAAIRYLERTVVGAAPIEGLVLRYGSLYGPGTSASGQFADLIRKRRLPVIGDGGGVWSFVHVDDASAATVLAVERGVPGVYNIVDDDPAPVSAWLPSVAASLGAPPPRRVPVWLGRLLAGEVGVSVMTRIRGSSNAKARRELGWTPQHPSWRDGFASRDGVDARRAA